MIQAVERHVCGWIAARLARLAAGSALFRAVTPLPGRADPESITLAAGGAAVLCRIDACRVVPAGDQVGMRAATTGEELHLVLEGGLHLVADDTALVAGAGVVADPPEAEAHQVDVLLFAALAGLNEQLRARADGVDAGRPEALRGWVELAAGDRRLRLGWDGGDWEPMRLTVAGGRRFWGCRMTLRARARLSPDAPSGGRILGIGARVGADVPVFIHAPAEALTLDHFAGLDAGLRTELADHGCTVLGDLVRIDAAALPLRTADTAGRQALVTLAGVAALRAQAARLLPAGRLDAELLALTADAIIAPDAAQRAVLARHGDSLAAQVRLAALAQVLAPLIAPARRGAVTLGHLLTVPEARP